MRGWDDGPLEKKNCSLGKLIWIKQYIRHFKYWNGECCSHAHAYIMVLKLFWVSF